MAVIDIRGTTSQPEGNGGSVTKFTYTITRDRVDDGGQYSYSTTPDISTFTFNADDLVDRNAILGPSVMSNQFLFPEGALTTTVDILVRGDDIPEPDEGFFFLVGPRNQNNAAFEANQIVVFSTILNDDGDEFRFSVSNTSFVEGDLGARAAFFTVTREGGTIAASVDFAITDNALSGASNATAQVDFIAPSPGTIFFAAGQTTATIPLQILGDTLVEGNEFIRITLTNPTNGGRLFRDVAFAQIIDDDDPSGRQVGTFDNDVLISTNRGNSILIGAPGNDTYLVYSQGDRVVESVNQGQDVVYTTVSYSLGENQVEAMSVAQQTTTDSINLTGNFISQIIVGNYGDNILNGGSGGIDTLIGLFGNDTYAVGDARMMIIEQAGQGFDTAVTSVSYTLGAGVSVEVFAAQDRVSTVGLRLTGNELAQTIAGTAGADTLSGGGGRDVLIGGAGADTFVIGTVAAGNVAVLADYAAGTDRIGLTSTAFNVGTSLDAAEFVAGTAATIADQRVIYDAGTGQLFYDADGNGAGAAVLFAQVVPGTAITAASFDVIVPTATAA